VRAFTLFATHYFELTALATGAAGLCERALERDGARGEAGVPARVKDGRRAAATGCQVPSWPRAGGGDPAGAAVPAAAENESAAHRDARTPQQELALGPPPEPDRGPRLLDALDPNNAVAEAALDAFYALNE